MSGASLIQDVALIAVLGVLVTTILTRVRLPAVTGLLLAGVLAGPHGLGLVHESAPLDRLAEVGVVLLLFSIGLEFSLGRLRSIFQRVALGSALQVGGTIAIATLLWQLAGGPSGQGVFIGFVFALSSSALVLRGLAERQELDAPHGRFIVGTQIFQDLCIIPMVLLVPILAHGGDGGEIGLALSLALGKALLVVGGIVLLARVLAPRLLGLVDASRSRETFLLTIVALSVGTAYLTSLVGLSLALGAFLGGMVVADTEYRHRAMGDVLPLRDAFVSIFFVTLGMLLDVGVVAADPLRVLILFLGFTAGKAAIVALAALVMRFPARAAWLAAVGLAQFSEFGFVLVLQGRQLGLIGSPLGEQLLAAGVASMFVTPLALRLAPHLTAGERLLAPLARLLGARGIDEQVQPHLAPAGHVLLVGFGVAGRIVAQALSRLGRPYVALELNADTVRQARAAGEQIFYGDATSSEALGHARLEQARAVVILINDPQAARRVADTVRRLAPALPILMRTRYLAERLELQATGATEVVVEELEGGMEVLARLLRWLDTPRNLLERELRRAREQSLPTERPFKLPRRSLPEHEALADLKIEHVLLTEHSRAVGRSPADLAVRERTGALIVAIRRDGVLLEQFDPEMHLRRGDVLYLAGPGGALAAGTAYLTEAV